MASGVYKRTEKHKTALSEAQITHGMTGTKIYNIWRAMKRRCLNKNCKEYKDYGGRGIKVCDRWMKFENFYMDMGYRPKGKSLDRIENDKGYCKSNCKWSFPKEQSNNMRNNNLITYKGKTQTLAQWSEELKMSRWKIKKLFNQI